MLGLQASATVLGYAIDFSVLLGSCEQTEFKPVSAVSEIDSVACCLSAILTLQDFTRAGACVPESYFIVLNTKTMFSVLIKFSGLICREAWIRSEVYSGVHRLAAGRQPGACCSFLRC